MFSLSGCTNSVEENLENYYYVMAIGLDTGTDTKINLSVQIASNSIRTEKQVKVQVNLIHQIFTLFHVIVLTLELAF